MRNTFTVTIALMTLLALTVGCKHFLPSKSKETKAKCAMKLPALATSQEYAARGMRESNEGDYECALDDCDKALELNEKNGEAIVCRGYVRLKRGEYDDAQSDFDRALELSPNDPLALHQRSQLYQRTKQFDKALADINKAIELFPADFYYVARAKIYVDARDDESALKDYAEAIRQKPETAYYYAERAEIYRRAGKIDLAAADDKKCDELKERDDEKNPLEPVKDDGAILNDVAVRLPKPVYPPAARVVNAKGKVRVLISVDSRGNVLSAQAISGHPLLKPAAEQAAKQAKFKPSAIETGILIFDFDEF